MSTVPENGEWTVAAAAERLAAPDITPEELADIAYRVPGLRDAVAEHPLAYPDLVEWVAFAKLRQPVAATSARAASAPTTPAPSVAAPRPASAEPYPVAPPSRRPRGVLVLLGAVIAVAVIVAIGLTVNGVRSHDSAANTAASGGGSALGVSDPYTPAPAPSETETEAPQTGAFPDLGAPAGTWTFTSAEGYSYTASLTLGSPQPASSVIGATNPEDSSFTLGSACDDINPDTDAVIAGYVQVESTTSDFPIQISTHFDVGLSPVDGADTATTAEVEIGYSDSPQCQSIDNFDDASIAPQWNSELQNGQSATNAFFIILHNYYTPENPSGDTGSLSDYVLTPDSSTNDDGQTFSPDTSAAAGVDLTGTTVADQGGE